MESTRRRRPSWTLASLLVALALAVTACGTNGAGNGNGNGNGPDPDPDGDSVEATLQELGLDTTATSRVAPDGSSLGDDDAPLGSGKELGDAEDFTNESSAHPTAELVIARNFFDHDTFKVEEIEGASVTPDGDIEFGSVAELADLSDGNAWIAPQYGDENQFQSLRSVAAGDFDGDGLDEVAAIYVDPADDVLKLKVFEDGVQTTQESLAAGAEVRSLTLIALDEDGDGSDELVAAIAHDDGVELHALADGSGGYDLDASTAIALPQMLPGSRSYVRLAAGNLDYDNGEELAVVVDEVDSLSSNMSGLATYYLFDDANNGRAELDSGSVQANVGGVVAAEAADVAVADIDGDGLDEVVLTGATNLAWGCNDEFDALLIALDDATTGFAQLDATVGDLSYRNCPAFAPWKLFFVFAATPDLDGDGVHEIAANQLIYDDFAETASFTPLEDVELPDTTFLNDLFDDGQFLSVATTAMVAADVTGDGRQNLMVYHQNRESMAVWGLSAIENLGANGNGWAQLSEIATPGQHNRQATARPILVPANVDADGPVLRYGAGSHQLVFTEPIVIAALASPPCSRDIAQNWGACVTSFGQGTSTGVDASLTVTVSASVFVGVEATANVPFVGDFGVKTKSTVTTTASAWAGTSYNVTKTITYSSGPLEDAVVFTSIPYDVYRYAIVSHPDPDLVGNDVVIRIPREPVTMIAEREFYNASLPADALHVDGDVFDHTAGDIGSYPSASRKNALLSTYGGLDFGPSGVGEGTGATEQQIAVSDEISAGGSLAIDFETEVEATAGVVMAGFSVGHGIEAALSVTSGEQTTYTGTVGSIAEADYAANLYQWGIFTYAQDHQDQKFEVINYWVE